MDINNQGDKPEVPSEEIQEPKAPEVSEDQKDEKKGASQRIKELSQQNKAASEQIQSLQSKIDELTKPAEEQVFEPTVQPGTEITPEQYKQDVTKTADSLVKLRMKQYEAESRIKSETVDVVKTYPQLDPNSNEFDQELSDTITQAVEAHIRVNPYSAEVRKFTDKLMKPYTRAVEKEVGQVTQNLAKQVSETALRPTSVRKQEKAASEMTLSELEAKLGVVNS